MPARAGIQGRAGMDTGFRRYDGSLMPIRRPVRICTCIFYGDTEFAEIRIYVNKKFLLRVLSVSAVNLRKIDAYSVNYHARASMLPALLKL